jgi:aspartate aminotransferase
MHLAERVLHLKESSTLAVANKASALRAAGEDVIIYGAGEPDFDTPANIKSAAAAALAAGKTKYCPTAGDPAAKKAIADKLKRDNAIDCTPADIIITAGAKHALYEALNCLLDSGLNQEVILPTPAWVSYKPLIELAGGVCVEVFGAMSNEFKITPAQLEKAVTPRTAGFIFNSPSNPCGVVYTADEIAALVDVLNRHPSIWVITDEIYEKLIYPEIRPGTAHRSIASFPGMRERTITINGMSKAYAMTGWRIGYACCAPGSDTGGSASGGLAAQMTKLQSQMTNNITSFTYAAIVEAFTGPQDSVESMRQAFVKRACLIQQCLTKAGLPNVQPTGAFYAFPDISAYLGRTTPGGRRIDAALAFADALLDEAKVAVVPGEDFGAGCERHVRLSFACPEAQIEKGCGRIADWLSSFR